MTQLTTLARSGAGTPVAPMSRLTRRAKAAIVVQFILKEGANVPLTALPEDLQIQPVRCLLAVLGSSVISRTAPVYRVGDSSVRIVRLAQQSGRQGVGCRV